MNPVAQGPDILEVLGASNPQISRVLGREDLDLDVLQMMRVTRVWSLIGIVKEVRRFIHGQGSVAPKTGIYRIFRHYAEPFFEVQHASRMRLPTIYDHIGP